MAVILLAIMGEKVAAKDVSKPGFWESLYRAGRTGWDLGGPTPIFQEWLRDNKGKGEKVCVIGAGNGHDAIAFAKAGYKVTAVDFAPTPARYLADKAAAAKLPLTVLPIDMFQLPTKRPEHFDLVLEYTTFCSIDPHRRDIYVATVASILKPEGRLLALFFPMEQAADVGPPFGLSRVEIRERFERYFHIVSEEWPEDSVPTRRLRELIVLMEKL